MRQISEKNLALFINLLANKLAQLQEEYENAEKNPEQLNDGEIEDLYQVQELIDQYTFILGNLQPEYEAGLAEGIVLPSFADLTRNLALGK